MPEPADRDDAVPDDGVVPVPLPSDDGVVPVPLPSDDGVVPAALPSDDGVVPAALPVTRPRYRWHQRIGLVARGTLIGAAEVVPGVSGGTVALVVGVYETIIRSAGHLVRGVTGVVRPGGDEARTAARRHLGLVDWGALVPILIGMFAAVVVGAAVLEPVLEEHLVQARALFAGLILASLVVPARMVGGRWTGREVAAGLLAAALAFGLTGLPPAAEQDPALPVVALAAAFAVCALVLPGVSGSFLLLTVGLYAPTLGAVNDRDLAYLGVFVLGAVLGLGLFVTGLQWLLERRRRITLVVMTGLMAGALRALWPWQDEGRSLEPVGEHAVAAVLLAGLGIAIVLLLVVAQRRSERGALSAAGRTGSPRSA